MSATINAQDLKQFRCFEGLNDTELNDALQTLDARDLKAGEILFEEGDTGDAVYLVGRGHMEIRVQVPGKPHRILATLEPGSIFGEMSLLLRAPRAATAAATTDATVWQITDAEFEAALDRREAWVCEFLHATAQALASRLGTLDRELVELMGQEQGDGAVERPEPAARVAELERLRQRLFTEWSF